MTNFNVNYLGAEPAADDLRQELVRLPDVTCDDGTVIKPTDACAAAANQKAQDAYAAAQQEHSLAVLDAAKTYREATAGNPTQAEIDAALEAYTSSVTAAANNFVGAVSAIKSTYIADVKAACCGGANQSAG